MYILASLNKIFEIQSEMNKSSGRRGREQTHTLGSIETQTEVNEG